MSLFVLILITYLFDVINNKLSRYGDRTLYLSIMHGVMVHDLSRVLSTNVNGYACR